MSDGAKIPIEGAYSRARGFTFTEILFVTLVISLLAAISIPIYTGFIRRARETAVIAYLSNIRKAEEIFRFEVSGNTYSGDFVALESTGAIPPGAGNAVRVAHEFRFTLAAGLGGGGDAIWSVNANPVNGSASFRWFYADETGIIRYETGIPAGPLSPPVK